MFPSELTATSSVFTYNGFDSQIEYQTSLDEILSNYLKVHTIKAHAQSDSVHYVAGVTSKYYDWSAYQRYVSKIKVQ